MQTWNFCPVCGHRIYQHTNDGGCTHVETTRHIVKLTSKGWTLKHPLAERESDKLFDCKVHLSLTERTWWPKPGEYALVENDSGGWAFGPVHRGREVCDCTVPYELLIVQRA